MPLFQIASRRKIVNVYIVTKCIYSSSLTLSIYYKLSCSVGLKIGQG